MPTTVLGFDTSGGWCAAAIVREGVVLAQRHMILPRGQGEALMPLLDDVLHEAGTGWADLTAIGVGIGPGNFTGIRISVSAARGLALGLGIPAIGVDRFDAAALDGPPLPVVVPALRGQVWVRNLAADPVLHDEPPTTAISDSEGLTPPAHPLGVAIALIAAGRAGTPQPRPAPLYLRDADAAPPSIAPPALIE